MSQKSYSILTASVKLAVPQGWTQAEVLEAIRATLIAQSSPFHPGTVIVKPLKREVTYL